MLTVGLPELFPLTVSLFEIQMCNVRHSSVHSGITFAHFIFHKLLQNLAEKIERRPLIKLRRNGHED